MNDCKRIMCMHHQYTKLFLIDTTDQEDLIIMDNLFANLLMTKKDYKAKVKRQQRQLYSAVSSELNAIEILESMYE